MYTMKKLKTSIILLAVIAVFLFLNNINVKADNQAQDIYVGESVHTNIENVSSIVSSEPDIVYVKNNNGVGIITAKKPGTAKVSIYYNNNLSVKEYQFNVKDNSNVISYKVLRNLGDGFFVCEIMNNTDINFWDIGFAVNVNGKEKWWENVWNLPANGKVTCLVNAQKECSENDMSLSIVDITRRIHFSNGFFNDAKRLPTKSRWKMSGNNAVVYFDIQNKLNKKASVSINMLVYNEKGKLIYGDQLVGLLGKGKKKTIKEDIASYIPKNTKKLKIKYWITSTSSYK